MGVRNDVNIKRKETSIDQLFSCLGYSEIVWYINPDFEDIKFVWSRNETTALSLEKYVVLSCHQNYSVPPYISVRPPVHATRVQNLCACARSLFSNCRLRMRTSQQECLFLS